MSAAAPPRRRIAVRVHGVVQGVGFRPAVFRLAEELGVGGFVLNDARGVLVEIEGAPEAVSRFVDQLPDRAPPLARIEGVEVTEVTLVGEGEFTIRASPLGGAPDALVAPDTATCSDCLRELLDPGDRRHRYPFTNCTNCGPRFTIVLGVPYDRPRTTMATFVMCSRCQAEYDDPHDRRFHAQPNACPDCGPQALLLSADGAADAVAGAAALLRDGAILAVKGIGGYHLACLAADELAVATLRARKHREDKPFAVLVADVAAARELVELDTEEEALLTSSARPIVLARRLAGWSIERVDTTGSSEQRPRPGAGVAAAVAPGLRELGVVLPYTPLHHLLARDVGAPLVLTSGNVSDEPIAFRDEDAYERLAPIADAFLVHDRPIHTRTDDSVARVVKGGPMVLRRSRGWVPDSLELPVPAERPVLAVGAELKSTFCVAKGNRAWVSHHIGDLSNVETLASFKSGIADFERLFDVAPEIVAHDLHPDLLSTSQARARGGVQLVEVQHHHAHLAACLAEHGSADPAVGAIYDGVGLGSDGTAWGGELLVGDLRGFERVGALVPVALPGGDRAAREPWRMACAWLVAAGAPGDIPPALAGRVEPATWHAVRRLCVSGFRAPPTTSMGRLFDAVAAVCGLHPVSTHEGQAAIALEAAADPAERGSYELPLTDAMEAGAPGGAGTPRWTLDARPTVLAAAADIAAGVAVGVVAARFHAAVAATTAAACERAAGEAGLGAVVLSGGVFQNRRLLEATAADLERRGLEVLRPHRIPPNDGGISFGQAAIAAATTLKQKARPA
ncbi:MAG: [NiFe] hydrogenase metallocenter assembly protein HypF [uncultured Solirubrobacteraceae bacterium]|uniref:Carbamoyltransferase n=1 Tax=uncultured Solirubrobacteraceae bacterium TaxID=1162706 RepID=A0A6J4SYB4_9ACTN|nr:MAG: [NiFe] hydrogenase metallocenter assembly protein HypF [uncultured Solirubrobacteraceae bacterium]